MIHRRRAQALQDNEFENGRREIVRDRWYASFEGNDEQKEWEAPWRKEVKTSKPFEGTPIAAFFWKRGSEHSADSNTQLRDEAVLETFDNKLQLITPKK